MVFKLFDRQLECVEFMVDGSLSKKVTKVEAGVRSGKTTMVACVVGELLKLNRNVVVVCACRENCRNLMNLCECLYNNMHFNVKTLSGSICDDHCWFVTPRMLESERIWNLVDSNHCVFIFDEPDLMKLGDGICENLADFNVVMIGTRIGDFSYFHDADKVYATWELNEMIDVEDVKYESRLMGDRFFRQFSCDKE